MAKFPRYPRSAHSSGQARIRWQGKQIYLGKFQSPESWTYYRELLAQATAGGPPVGAVNRLTVAEVLALWIEAAPKHYAASSREPEQFIRAIRPVRELFAATPAADFGPRALQRVQQAMIAKGWCRNVVNRRIIRVKTLFRWAESQELVPRGTFHALSTVPAVRSNTPGARSTAKVKPATWEAVKAVARHAPLTIRTMLLLQWWSGMRSCEVRLIRTQDIDLSGPVWVYTPLANKNAWRDRERPIVLGPKCKALLRRWLQAQDPAAFIFCPADRHGRKHLHFTEGSYTYAVRRASWKAGVMVHPYQCRHACKLRIERALGSEAARAQLGHSTIDTTAHYGGHDLELAKLVARRLG